MNIKAYWRGIFVDNWQTTSVGLTTVISTAINYAYAWTHPPPGMPPGMPNPDGYVVPFLGGLFLIFRAIDSKHEVKP